MSTDSQDLEQLHTSPGQLIPAGTMNDSKSVSAFSSEKNFESAQRMAKMLASSSLVPKNFQENIADCVIALELSQRLGASPLAIMQNLYVVHGKPGWSAQYVIAALNTCGKFAPLRFDMTGEGDTRSCTAWTVDKTNERLEGPKVDIVMAKAEGWYQKNGSKWQTMPELMLRYRAAAFFGRLYAPEIMMGMQTTEELTDIIDVTPDGAGNYSAGDTGAGVVEDLNAKLNPAAGDPPAGDPPAGEAVVVDAKDAKPEKPPKGEATPTRADILQMIQSATCADELDAAESCINDLPKKDMSTLKSELLNKRAEIVGQAQE